MSEQEPEQHRALPSRENSNETHAEPEHRQSEDPGAAQSRRSPNLGELPAPLDQELLLTTRQEPRATASRMAFRKAGPVAEGQSMPEAAVASASASSGFAADAAIVGRVAAKLGADFSNVRFHTGAESEEAAGAIGARAYTIGSDIHFGKDQYKPGSSEGDRLIAHELTHVVQQGLTGPTRQNKLDVSQPEDPAELEADSIAEDVVGNRETATVQSGGLQKADTALSRKLGGDVVMRSGWKHDASRLNLLVDDKHKMPNLILPRYAASGRTFKLSVDADFCIYHSLRFELSGANSGRIGSSLPDIWSSETMRSTSLPNAGETTLAARLDIWFGDNVESLLNFNAYESALQSGPTEHIDKAHQLDVSQAKFGGQADGTAGLTTAFSNAVAFSETATNGYTRTLAQGSEQSIGGEIGVSGVVPGVSSKVSGGLKWSKTESDAFANSFAQTSGITSTQTTTFTNSVNVKGSKGVYVAQVPQVDLTTIKFSYLPAGQDGVVTGPVKDAYFHIKKVVGMLFFQGATAEELNRKIAAGNISGVK
jgi:hypothetical protein